MIIDSFDIKTKTVMDISDFYGKCEKIIDICIVTFSKIIFDNVSKKYNITQIASLKACNGDLPIYMFEADGKKIGIYLSQIGSALAAQMVIEVSYVTGATKFIMFGSAGSLDRNATSGKFVIPTEAYRDEGMSYHYASPADYITIKNASKMKEIFNELNVPYVMGRNWTTDAFLRETVGLMNERKKEGCISVEMELAGVQAVCDFYGFELYNFLATGDVLADDNYDVSGLHNANHNLDKFYIALEIVKRI